jgi:intein/homing endonuclease
MESRKKRKKRLKNHQSKFKIRVRYKYHYYRWISTQDYGSFKDIYEKYKDKGYSFWCVPKGDTVFTNPGIESMGEQLDSIVSVNGNYELPSRYFERDYAGDLVVVKPFLLPETRLTPEHPVLACESNPQKSKWYDQQTRPSLKKTWKPAGELTEKDWVFFPLFKGNREGDPELLYLLGLYMAEGYPTGNQVCFSLGHTERPLAEHILRMAEKHWSVKGTVNAHRTGLLVRFSKAALADFMRKEFGSRAVSKKIPSWIIEQRDPQPFLEGWLKGDGFKRGNTWRLATSSKTAAYQALLMGSRLGILPAIYKDDRKERGVIQGRKVNAKPSYEIRFHQDGSKYSNKPSHVVKTENGFWVKINKIQREKFSGKVCNMETPSNTYLLSFIVHNCADLPPEYSSQDGTWTGYRLDGDKTHTESTLKRYGRHKAWIDSSYKFEGKNVILVYNAATRRYSVLLRDQ